MVEGSAVEWMEEEQLQQLLVEEQLEATAEGQQQHQAEALVVEGTEELERPLELEQLLVVVAAAAAAVAAR